MGDTLSDEALADLLTKALAATPGPWQACEPYRSSTGLRKWSVVGSPGSLLTVNPGSQDADDAVFIAAANPSTVALIIREVMQLRSKVRQQARALELGPFYMGEYEHG